MKTKEKILYATLSLAQEKGLGRVSMNDIAQEIGIRKPSLYNHYKSKEVLMDTMFTFIMDKAKAKMPKDNLEQYVNRFPIEAVLFHCLDVYSKWYQDEDVTKLTKVILSEKMTNPIAAQLDLRMGEDMIIYFSDVIIKLKTEGKCNVKNVTFAAKLLVYHLLKLIELTYLGQDAIEKDIYELCRVFTSIFSNSDL